LTTSEDGCPPHDPDQQARFHLKRGIQPLARYVLLFLCYLLPIFFRPDLLALLPADPADLLLHFSWSVEHPKIWLDVKIVQRNLLKYSQFHVDRPTSDGLAQHGIPMASHDGGVEMWANTVEELMAVSPIDPFPIPCQHSVPLPDYRSCTHLRWAGVPR